MTDKEFLQTVNEMRANVPEPVKRGFYWLPDELISDMANFGAHLSRHCRNCWTGEQTKVSVPFDQIGYPRARYLATLLERRALIAIERVADLRQYRLGRSGQHSWKASDWKRAIREFRGR